MDGKEVKNISLKNEKLKANRASETEEQRKERLRIRVKMIEQEGEPKKYNKKRKWSSETEDHQKQRLVTL